MAPQSIRHVPGDAQNTGLSASVVCRCLGRRGGVYSTSNETVRRSGNVGKGV